MSPRLALFLVPLVLLVGAIRADAQAPMPAGDVEAGKRAWALALRCANCHGPQGEGGYGPDLAGRGISAEAFRLSVRRPWGVMPAYTETQLSDQTVADMFAFLNGLPRVANPGGKSTYAYTVTATTPVGQKYMIDTAGCASCHQAELRQPRKVLGGEAADVNYELFEKMIYNHTDLYPSGRMGNFSRARLPEPVLREIFRFVKDDLGWLVPITARVDAGTPAGSNTTYTVTILNSGHAGKGLSAEDVTISVMLPPGAQVVTATGDGYQGVRPAAQGHAATWKVARIGPTQELKYTLTLAGAGAPGMFANSTVGWTKPAMRPGVPDLVLRDTRSQGKDDYMPIALPPRPQPAQ